MRRKWVFSPQLPSTKHVTGQSCNIVSTAFQVDMASESGAKRKSVEEVGFPDREFSAVSARSLA